MKLFIRIKDGLPFEHPIFEDNFKTAFPKIDINNLPSDFALFERIEQPSLGAYEVYEGVTYEWFDGVVKDVHHVRQMTTEEKTEKQEAYKQFWNEKWGYASWTFNEEKCVFDPPIPYPEDADTVPYVWDEENQTFVAQDVSQPTGVSNGS